MEWYTMLSRARSESNNCSLVDGDPIGTHAFCVSCVVGTEEYLVTSM
jgi:hypothetical protein